MVRKMVKQSVITYMVADYESMQVTTPTITRTGRVSKRELIKELTEYCDENNGQFLKILRIDEQEIMYEMDLETFIANATKVTE